MKKNSPPTRPERDGTHRLPFERAKKKIYATQTVCGICGKPVDFAQKYPQPLSPCIDHIIPVAKGGHPSDISNLQLAHWTCNRQKSDKIFATNKGAEPPKIISNRQLPQACDWTAYKAT
ncbi:MAG: HNH endonuclease [Oscillospiraceae bacterium]